MKRSRQVVRGFLGAVFLASALAAGWRETPTGHAAVISRGDPIFWIGPDPAQCTCDTKLQMRVDIAATRPQVQQITYAIHGPQGTAVHAVIFTGGKLHGLESYTFVADQPANHYLVVTTVTTSDTVPVQVSEQLVANHTSSSASSAPAVVSGQSNEAITTSGGSDE